MIKMNDLFAVSLLLIGVWIIAFITGMTNEILNLFGIIGGIIIIIVEAVFLWNVWFKR